MVKYSQFLFWQMATLAFWSLMGKTNVLAVKKRIAKNKTVIYMILNTYLFIFQVKPDIPYATWLRFNTCVQAICAPDLKPIKPVGFLPARIMSVSDGILDDAKHSHLLQMISVWLPILYMGKQIIPQASS